ncbi:MAG TPA: DUF2203 domain-containing protein [Gemmatimonadales bacterium]|jgi:hypothetical protein
MPDPRLFTLDEAERTLPLVRQIVSDIRNEYREWRDAVTRYELEAAGATADSGETDLLRALRERVGSHAERVAVLVEELQALGVELKDFEQGLVDFYALREDRLVYLCWRLGEDHITHWHEVDEGFPGRRPVDAILTRGVVP